MIFKRLLILVVVFSALLNLQTLSAQEKFEFVCSVKDAITNQPCIGASIYIKELNKTGTTNEKGIFVISIVAGKYQLKITSVGYQNFEKELIVDQNFELSVLLKSQIINKKEVEVTSEKKTIFKKTGLYDISAEADEANIEGFYALNLFNDNLTNEIWFTNDKKCIEVTTNNAEHFKGKASLNISWDKINGGCPWIGMGIGWNAWQGKDISSLIGKAAIQMYIKTKGDTLKGLPLALALEDYSNVQAWAGFSPTFIEGGKITSQWTKVIIPFNAFPVAQQDLDDTNIKQFMIQFEADGNLFIDEITIVPFEGILKPQLIANKKTNEIIVDGKIDYAEWGQPSCMIDNNQVFLKYDEKNIFIAASIIDNSALINQHDDAEIWNGDAIEISFGFNAGADLNRTRYLFSDYQIGIKATENNPYIYNWKKKERMKDVELKTQKTEMGYDIEVKIPLSSFDNPVLMEGLKYGFEIAIDDGDASGNRNKQMRWSSPQAEGFNLNPSLWGLLLLK